MASASTQDNHKHNILCSHFNQTVCLSDWWLVKTEDVYKRRRLAVAGFASRGNNAKRVFSSSPILKWHNVFNIETTDGICVFFEGFINKARTEENGFPSNHRDGDFSVETASCKKILSKEGISVTEMSKEGISVTEKINVNSVLVFKHFVFGFPPYWEEYQEYFMDKDSSLEDTLGFTHLKSPSSQRSEIESGQPHVDNCAEDLESQQKSKRSESPAVSLPKNPDTVNSNHEKSVGEKIRAKFASSMGSEKVTPVDCEPGQGRNNWNFEAFEFHKCTYKMKPSEFGTPKVKSKDNNKKAKAKATRSRGTSADAADNPKDNVTPDTNNVSDNAKSSDIKTRRKLAYETPDQEKQEVRASPQCMSFSRSRSGRLLMPTLEFWRNQRAIYSPDRTLTGIEEGRINPDPKIKGSPSTTRRKRKRRQPT